MVLPDAWPPRGVRGHRPRLLRTLLPHGWLLHLYIVLIFRIWPCHTDGCGLTSRTEAGDVARVHTDADAHTGAAALEVGPDMPYSRRFGSGYAPRGGHMKSSSGTVYGYGGGNYLIRRHSFKRTIELEPGTAKVIPLLARTNDGLAPLATNISSLEKVANQGTEVYINGTCQEGSRVDMIQLDITGHPKAFNNTVVMDIYGLDCALSYHDVLSNTVYGLHWDGKKIQYSNEAASNPTMTDMIRDNGSFTPAPVLPLTREVYNLGDVIKHWWGVPYKNVMYGGEPLIATMRRRVPSKCRRINFGTFYGMLLMHDGASVPNSDADTLSFEIIEDFTEVPLVQ